MPFVKIEPLKSKGQTKKAMLSFLDDVKRIVAEEAVETRQDYERTVETWAKKPIFIIEFAPNRLSARIYTDNEIYKYVNDGTPPHPIAPKAPGYPLRFGAPSSPKTRVMQIRSFDGSVGDTTVRTMFVNHPGTKARNFSKVIARANQRSFTRKMQAVIKKMQGV